jgi:outer membrane immunogenic protein
LRLSPLFLMSLVAISSSFASADEVTRTPLPTWTGFYAGVNAGGLWNSSTGFSAVDWSRLTLPSMFANSAALATTRQPNFAWSSSAGFMGGGQVGYNWQITNNIVVGVETDFQGVAGGERNWGSGGAGSSSTHGPNSIGSVRGRAGYLVAPTLQVYGTGGMAYSR